MSLTLPRLLARSSALSSSPLFSSLSLSSASSPVASSSRRAASSSEDQAPKPGRMGTGERWGDSPDQELIPKMLKPNVYSEIVPTHPISTDWKKINQDIVDRFPKTIVGTTHYRPCPEPKAPIDTTDAFLQACGRGLAAKVKTGAADLTWEQMFKWDSAKWKDIGLDIPLRKYLMNCLEKYRLGYDPRAYSTIPKRPKKFRKHGLAVQDGVRMKWSTKLDIGHARRPWGLKAVVKIKRDE